MIFLALRLLLLRWALFDDTFRKVIKHERIAHRIRYAFNAYRYCFFFFLLIVTKNLFLFDHRLALFLFVHWMVDRWIIIFRCNSFMLDWFTIVFAPLCRTHHSHRCTFLRRILFLSVLLLVQFCHIDLFKLMINMMFMLRSCVFAC